MEPNNWPEFKLFDPVERIKSVARAVGRFLSPSEPPLSQSDHYIPEHLQEPTDGEAMPSVQDLVQQSKEAREE